VRFAFLLVLVLVPDDRAVKFFDRIKFEKPASREDEARRVSEVLLKKDHWLGAFRTLEEKYGKFPDDLELTVDFTHDGDAVGVARSLDSKGQISFNLKRLIEGQKRLDELDRMKQDARERGQRLIVKVPPLKFDRIIYHEMTHILQRSYEAPSWFLEGMAELVGEDENTIYALAASGRRVKDIDDPVAERIDTYGRGHLFWKWLHERGWAKKAIDLSIVQRRPWKEALEEATKIPWTVMVASERDWSLREVESRR